MSDRTIMPDFRKAVGSLARFAAGKAKGAAALAARKTQNVSRIARLNVDISGERDTIKQAYSEIGKLYFETHRDAPEPYFEQLCREIETCMETIAAKEAEIVRLKTEEHAARTDGSGPAIEVEIVQEPEDAAPVPEEAPLPERSEE